MPDYDSFMLRVPRMEESKGSGAMSSALDVRPSNVCRPIKLDGTNALELFIGTSRTALTQGELIARSLFISALNRLPIARLDMEPPQHGRKAGSNFSPLIHGSLPTPTCGSHRFFSEHQSARNQATGMGAHFFQLLRHAFGPRACSSSSSCSPSRSATASSRCICTSCSSASSRWICSDALVSCMAYSSLSCSAALRSAHTRLVSSESGNSILVASSSETRASRASRSMRRHKVYTSETYRTSPTSRTYATESHRLRQSGRLPQRSLCSSVLRR